MKQEPRAEGWVRELAEHKAKEINMALALSPSAAVGALWLLLRMAYTDDELNSIYDRNRGRCFYCDMALSFQNYGVVGRRAAWEVDHFIPIASGGAHQPYNWVAACVGCNTEKADLLPWEFAPSRFRRGDRDPDDYI